MTLCCKLEEKMSECELKNSKWADKWGEVRVMCEPIEGYVLIRRKGVAPFIVTVKQLNRDYTPLQGDR